MCIRIVGIIFWREKPQLASGSQEKSCPIKRNSKPKDVIMSSTQVLLDLQPSSLDMAFESITNKSATTIFYFV